MYRCLGVSVTKCNLGPRCIEPPHTQIFIRSQRLLQVLSSEPLFLEASGVRRTRNTTQRGHKQTNAHSSTKSHAAIEHLPPSEQTDDHDGPQTSSIWTLWLVAQRNTNQHHRLDLSVIDVLSVGSAHVINNNVVDRLHRRFFGPVRFDSQRQRQRQQQRPGAAAAEAVRITKKSRQQLPVRNIEGKSRTEIGSSRFSCRSSSSTSWALQVCTRRIASLISGSVTCGLKCSRARAFVQASCHAKQPCMHNTTVSDTSTSQAKASKFVATPVLKKEGGGSGLPETNARCSTADALSSSQLHCVLRPFPGHVAACPHTLPQCSELVGGEHAAQPGMNIISRHRSSKEAVKTKQHRMIRAAATVSTLQLSTPDELGQRRHE